MSKEFFFAKQLRKPFRSGGQNGAALLYLVAAILIAGTLGAAIVSLTTTSTLGELGYNNSDQARHLAQSGLDYAKARLQSGDENFKNGEDETVFELQKGQFVLTVEPKANNNYDIISEGRINSSDIFTEASFKIALYNYNPPTSFTDYITEENVFVYGTHLSFEGNEVKGDGATIVIEGDLNTDDFNRGASLEVSNIYFDGNVSLDGGSTDLGSSSEPGAIYVNGDLELWNGGRDIYGDVYVNGDFRLKDAKIHGNVYVAGDVELGWTPSLSDTSNIYYTGVLSHPDNYDQSILDKCIWQESVPGFSLPGYEIPGPRPDQWYADRGYVSEGDLADDLKIFTEDNYTYTKWNQSVSDVVIVSTGDITITGQGGSSLSGVLIAPYGSVTFEGKSFEGTVLARDGFYVESGGTTITFRNIEEYFSSPEDIPLQDG